jgi:hypothetical protein
MICRRLKIASTYSYSSKPTGLILLSNIVPRTPAMVAMTEDHTRASSKFTFRVFTANKRQTMKNVAKMIKGIDLFIAIAGWSFLKIA